MEKFTATQTQKDAANCLILAMAYTQTIRPELEKIQQDVLNKFRYKWELDKVCGKQDQKRSIDEFEEFTQRHGEYCKTWFDTYLISDKDFSHCLTEYHARFTQKGFKVKEFGFCPLLVAESIEREARGLLIDEMEPVTGIKYDDFFRTTKWKENMDKYIDLTLRLLSPYLKNTLQAA